MYTALGTTVVSNDTVKVLYRKLKIKEYIILEAGYSSWPTDVDETRLREVVDCQYSITRELIKELNVSAISTSFALCIA